MIKPIAHCFALTLLGLTACTFPKNDCTGTETLIPTGGGPGTAEMYFVVWAGAWIYCGIKGVIEAEPTDQRAQMQRQADAGDAESELNAAEDKRVAVPQQAAEGIHIPESKRRADGGDVAAQIEFADHLMLTSRWSEARAYLCRAASVSTDAQFTLGAMRAGSGLAWNVPDEHKDIVEAYSWFAMAAAGGHPKAAAEHARLASELTPKQEEEAKTLAEGAVLSRCESAIGKTTREPPRGTSA